MIPSEMPREGLGRLRAALGLRALLMDQPADQFLHRHADPARLPPQPGLVSRIDVANSDASAYVIASGFIYRPAKVVSIAKYAI